MTALLRGISQQHMDACIVDALGVIFDPDLPGSAFDGGGLDNLAPNAAVRSTCPASPQLAVPIAGQAAPATAYTSPLLMFGGYRLNPYYRLRSQQKLDSLTYSSTIDPAVPLCPYELNGACNDETCSFQHLANIVPTSCSLVQVYL